MEQYQIPVGVLKLEENLPEPDAWWFGTHEEVANLGGKGVGMNAEEVDDLLALWAMARHQESPPTQLLIGVDPGPRPGCAFFSDGVLMGKRELESQYDALSFILRLVMYMSPKSVLVKIGHGSPQHRDQFINQILGLGYHVEEVDESRTSAGTSRHHHGLSAVKIAMMGGKAVFEQRIRNPTKGEVRNIQRLSRQKSDGQLSISQDKARQVLEGHLTLDEALTASGYDSS